jgi:hypothetical protein
MQPSKLRMGRLSADPEKPFLALNPLNACPQGGAFDLRKFDMDDGADGETNLLKAFKSDIWKHWNSNPTVDPSRTRLEIGEEDENTCLVLNVNTPKVSGY